MIAAAADFIIVVTACGGIVTKGRILWFNDVKGYGWIEDEAGAKYFACSEEFDTHSRAVLAPGQKVQFKKAKLSNSAPVMGVEHLASKIRLIEK